MVSSEIKFIASRVIIRFRGPTDMTEEGVEENILSIADRYDTFFVDVYGVLYNGVLLYKGTLETMSELKKQGKRIVILSNSTMVSEDARRSYESKGMYKGVHYDQFITSGEYLHYALTSASADIFREFGSREEFFVKCLFIGNSSVFANSRITKTDSFDAANVIYVGVPRTSYGSLRIDNLSDENGSPVKVEEVIHRDWHKLRDPYGRKGTGEFASILEKCLQKQKILLVANPDMFAYESEMTPENKATGKAVPVFTQGILGKYYERMGGKVVYFGKPYSGIYEFASRFTKPNDKVVMVGDTPWTDILGANNFGIDSAMVMTGVSREFLNRGEADKKNERKVNLEELLYEVSDRICGSARGKMTPTYVLKRFAACNTGGRV